jgi:ferredoxin-NADP reductase
MGDGFDATGHLSRSLFEEDGVPREADVYSSGPTRFIADMKEALATLGVPRHPHPERSQAEYARLQFHPLASQATLRTLFRDLILLRFRTLVVAQNVENEFDAGRNTELLIHTNQIILDGGLA